MTEAQIQLQNALTTTFLANLAFLSEYDNELYHRVDELSRMIEYGEYQEKYALEFIMEDGDFDIYDIVNDKYLYNKKPKKINDDLVRKIQFDEKNSIYFIEEEFTIKNKLDINIHSRFEGQSIEEFVRLTQNDMFQYANILNEFLEKKEKKIKKIEKFIFLGTLLGRHIPKIAKKINAQIYLVLERNLEIFRLSLFTVDYTILAKRGVLFSIMDDNIKEETKIRKFLKISLFENYMIKFSTTRINIEKYIDNINTSLIIVNNASQYNYNRYLYVYVNRVTNYLKNNYNILLMNDLKKNLNFFSNKPVLYIAAGPSLDENIEWIKKNQNKFFIVTIGAAYKKLIKNNIKIDILTTLDEQEILDKIQFDDENISKLSEKTIILASTLTNEKILKKFNKNNLFLFEVFFPFFKNNEVVEGCSVGEVTLGILLKMNIKEIYLIGLDLALNQDTGLSHSVDSSSGINKYYLKNKQNKEIFSIRKGLITVKGNQKKEVSTISIFYNSIKALEELLENKMKTKIYNLSSHGAYFEKTIPLKPDSIIIENFKDLNYDNSNLIKIFIQNSRKTLEEESKFELKEDLKELNRILTLSLISLENIKINNFEEFYEYIINFHLSINVNNRIILMILKNYFMFLLPYLSYHFNDKELKNESKKIEKIKKIFLNQIKLLLSDYKQCLERIVYN